MKKHPFERVIMSVCINTLREKEGVTRVPKRPMRIKGGESRQRDEIAVVGKARDSDGGWFVELQDP